MPGMKTPVVATIGDGTFFHAGIPALSNVSHTQTDLTIIILNNQWASMTGMQPNVGTEKPPYSDGKADRQDGGDHESGGHPACGERQSIPDAQDDRALKERSRNAGDGGGHCQRRMFDPEDARPKKSLFESETRTMRSAWIDAEPSCIEVLGCPALDRGDDGKAVIISDSLHGVWAVSPCVSSRCDLEAAWVHRAWSIMFCLSEIRQAKSAPP